MGFCRRRRSAWIDLITNDSDGVEPFYAAAVGLMREFDARPHLGRFCDGIGRPDLERVHGADFVRFLALVEQHDPEGRFGNALTRRLFGSVPPPCSRRHDCAQMVGPARVRPTICAQLMRTPRPC